MQRVTGTQWQESDSEDASKLRERSLQERKSPHLLPVSGGGLILRCSLRCSLLLVWGYFDHRFDYEASGVCTRCMRRYGSVWWVYSVRHLDELTAGRRLYVMNAWW